jgi:Tfp pilus assembly protein PilF
MLNLRVFARRRRSCRGAPDTQTEQQGAHVSETAHEADLQEEDDDERGYLLLASLYIENGKYDLAQGLLNKAIASNKSCCRAWELLGLIYEKEQSYKDASDCHKRPVDTRTQKSGPLEPSECL